MPDQGGGARREPRTAGWEIFEAIGNSRDDRQDESHEILGEMRVARRSDEHVVQLRRPPGEQAKAVQLLTKLRNGSPTRAA